MMTYTVDELEKRYAIANANMKLVRDQVPFGDAASYMNEIFTAPIVLGMWKINGEIGHMPVKGMDLLRRIRSRGGRHQVVTGYYDFGSRLAADTVRTALEARPWAHWGDVYKDGKPVGYNLG